MSQGESRGWKVVGGLEIDSAMCAIGNAMDFNRMGSEDIEIQAHDAAVLADQGLRVAVCGTGGDFSMPVEVTRSNINAVIGVRTEFVDDLVDVPGEWVLVGKLALEGQCMAGDPHRTGECRRVNFDIHPGVYDVEIFRPEATGWDCLGLRAIDRSRL